MSRLGMCHIVPGRLGLSQDLAQLWGLVLRDLLR